MPEQSLNYEEEEVSETDCIVEDVGAEELKEKARQLRRRFGMHNTSL